MTAWFEAVPSEEIFLSVLTIGELRRGIESIRRRDVPTAKALEAWLQDLIGAHAEHLLPVSQEVSEQWGRFNVPDPLPVVDGLLAATARIHGLTLVTRNLRDVERTGVSCLNPFRAAG